MLYDWKLFPNYVRTFGLFRGPRTFWKIHLRPKRAGTQFRVQVGNHTFWLRNSRSDISIFFQVVVQQEYDTRGWREQHEGLQRQYRELVERERTPIIIDAGANIGLASLWFAELFPLAKIYAIEPNEANLGILRRNIAGHANIIPLAGAVWDRSARLRIENPEAGAASLRAGEGEGNIQAYTVPEIVNHGEGELFIVKIDIEGGEEALFRSNTDWLADASLTVLELHDWLYPGKGISRNFLRCVSAQPVDFVFRGENVFCFRIR
jgi:FkbM family methyltransferase